MQVGAGPGHGTPQARHHVVITAAATVAVLRVINLTNIHDDPQALQVVLKRQHPAVIATGWHQQFKAQRLAGGGVDPALVFYRPTRRIEQGIGFE